MTNCKPVFMPMNLSMANPLLLSKHPADQATMKWHQSAIGSLISPAVNIRPDITYSIRLFRRHCANLGPIYCSLGIQILQYLTEILKLGIIFKLNVTDELDGYTNSDWAEFKDERR